MKIAVNPIKSFFSTQSTCYVVRVDKSSDCWIEYVVDIAPLSPHLYCLFTERYEQSLIKNHFFMVNFYSLDALFTGAGLFNPEPRMRYRKHELKEMLLEGIGKAIAVFIHHCPSCVLVALPTRPGLGKIYDELLSAHAHSSGCLYVTQYKEDGIYVIEK